MTPRLSRPPTISCIATIKIIPIPTHPNHLLFFINFAKYEANVQIKTTDNNNPKISNVG